VEGEYRAPQSILSTQWSAASHQGLTTLCGGCEDLGINPNSLSDIILTKLCGFDQQIPCDTKGLLTFTGCYYFDMDIGLPAEAANIDHYIGLSSRLFSLYHLAPQIINQEVVCQIPFSLPIFRTFLVPSQN